MMLNYKCWSILKRKLGQWYGKTYDMVYPLSKQSYMYINILGSSKIYKVLCMYTVCFKFIGIFDQFHCQMR